MASKLWGVCLFILVVEMMERLSYYTFQGSQRNFLSQWYSSAEAIAINSAFGVLCYAAAVLGGWVADAKLGRFRTILLFLGMYVVGVVLAAGAAWPSFNSKILYLVGMFAFVAVGTGGIKPNVSNFGADQYDTSIPKEVVEQESFFSYFYMVINLGAIVAFGYLVTLATNGQPPGIPQEYGYFAAYTIAAGCMIIALGVFLLGSPQYVKKKPDGDSLQGAGYYIWHAARRNVRGAVALVGWICTILFIVFSFASAFVPEDAAQAVAYTSLAIALVACVTLAWAHLNDGFMDGIPDHPKGLLTLKEAQDFFAVVPTILAANICFEIVYNMMNGPLVLQACQMNLQVGSGQLNGAFLNIADCFSIIAFTPVLDMLVFPLIKRLKKSPVTRNQKLVAGFVTAGLAMLSALILEYARKAAPVMDESDPNNISNCAGNPETSPVPMSDISAFWMVIPFGLIGIAEILINPLLYFFSYDQVPPRARSLAQAFNLLAQGSLSQGFTTVITLIFAPFLGSDDNLNNGGALQNFYWLGLAVSILGIPLVLLVSNFYVEKDFKDHILGVLGEEEDKKGSELAVAEPERLSNEPVPVTDSEVQALTAK